MTPGEQLHADPVTGESSTPAQRSQGALAHALALLGFIVPFAGIIAPLIIMVNDKGPGNSPTRASPTATRCACGC